MAWTEDDLLDQAGQRPCVARIKQDTIDAVLHNVENNDVVGVSGRQRDTGRCRRHKRQVDKAVAIERQRRARASRHGAVGDGDAIECRSVAAGDLHGAGISQRATGDRRVFEIKRRARLNGHGGR